MSTLHTLRRWARRWSLPACVILLALAVSERASARQEPGRPGEQASSFDLAVRTYRAADYARAHQLFAELVDGETDAGRRAVLHANAGTAAARAGRLGESIWHFEAARRLTPRDELVGRNLAQVRQRLSDGEVASDVEASQLTTALLRSPLQLTPRENQQLLALAATLVVLLVALRRVGWAGRWATTLAVTVLVLGAVWSFGEATARQADLRRAVVLRQVAVRSEPDSNGGVLFRLTAGMIVEDAEVRGDWRLIETEGGARGWVPASLVRAAGT